MTVSFIGSGALGGLMTTVTGTLNTFAAVSNPNIAIDTDVELAWSETLTSNTQTNKANESGQTIYLSTTDSTALAFSFSVETATSKTVVTSIAAIPGVTLPAGVTAGTSNVVTDAVYGKVAVTVTATAAVSGTGYVFSAGDNSVTVYYRTPSPVKIYMSPSVDIASVVGGSNTVSTYVKDQYANGYPGAIISFIETGSRNATSGTVLSTATSDATGKASYTLVDAKTGITTTDVIKATAIFAGSSTTLDSTTNNGGGKGSITITYAASITPAKVVLTFAAATGSYNTSTADGFSALAPGHQIGKTDTYTATLTDAAGSALPNGVLVNFTISGGVTADGLAATTKTAYTADGNGKASILVIPTKTGKITVTATSGGVSATDSSVTGTQTGTYSSGVTGGRTVALDAATYAVTGGTLKRVSATVKDAYGNPVAGAGVTFSISTGAGRFAGGQLSAEATTDATGVAIADLAPVSTESGAGTLKVAIKTLSLDTTTAGATVYLPDGVNLYPAAAASATAALTITAGAATATTDAATTSKINDIATAVANLSTTVAGLVASLVAQIKDTKAAIADTKAALDALAAVVAKIQKKVKA